MNPNVAALGEGIKTLSIAMTEGLQAMREQLSTLEQENESIQH